MNTQNYVVNIRVGLANPARVNISQGDTGRTLAFSLYDGLSPFTPPTGSTVTIVGRKPSKLGFSEACTVSGNVATVTTTLAMTQEAGKFPVELRIEANGESIGTANFTMYIEPSPHPDGTTDGTHATVDNLQTQIGNLANLATTAKTNLVSAINEAAQSGGVVIDDTLTQTGQAADAKKTGDEIGTIKADLDNVDERLAHLATITQWEQGLYSASSGAKEWSNSRIRTTDYLEDGIACIYASDNLIVWPVAWDETDAFIGTWTGEGFTNVPGEIVRKNFWDFKELKTKYPYAKVKLNVASSNNLSESVLPERGNSVFLLNTWDNAYVNEKIADAGKSIDFLTDFVGGKNLLLGLSWDNGPIMSDGGVLTNAGFRHSSLIPVQSGTYTLIYNCLYVKENVYTRIHRYDANGVWQNQIAVFETAVVLGRHTETFVCPDGFIKISTGSENKIDLRELYTGQKIADVVSDVRERVIELETTELEKQAKALGLHSTPDSFGALNAVKRARQLTDFKWSPAGDFARTFLYEGDTGEAATHVYYVGKFAKGKEYCGVPYTARVRLGIEASFDAFATSVANENSVQIVGSILIGEQQTSYYGVVCSDLVSYTMDIPGTGTSKIPNVQGMTKIGSLYGADKLALEQLKIADYLVKPSHHCCIISDIAYENGNVTYIEISESTRYGNANPSITDGPNGGKCRRFALRAEDFYAFNSMYDVYRYGYIDKVKYIPSKYTPMVDELKPLAVIDYPCLPYHGNYASYSTYGVPLVKILIAATGFNNLRVTNGDGVVTNYDVTNLTDITLTLPQTEMMYTAKLQDIQSGTLIKETESCTFYTRPYIEPVVTISNGVANFSWTVKSGVFKPWFITFNDNRGNTADFTILRNGVVETENGNGTTTYTWNMPVPSDATSRWELGFISEHFGSANIRFNVQL